MDDAPRAGTAPQAGATVIPLRRPQTAQMRQDTANDQAVRTRINLVVGAIVILLLVSGLWLVDRLKQISNIQDCVMQGRRNCAPIAAPPREPDPR